MLRKCGWRRSRLGGSSGSHFYASWARATATPLKDAGFQAESDAIVLRDIRHHDDHAPLHSGDASKDYLLLTVSDLRGTEYAPEPWTSAQARFARGHGAARILKGHPGSGKTTVTIGLPYIIAYNRVEDDDDTNASAAAISR